MAVYIVKLLLINFTI